MPRAHEVAGAIPASQTVFRSGVAQLVERDALNVDVDGPTPSTRSAA